MTAPILPPATIGMLGGGQLGRYALMAARTMGYRTVVLDPDPSAPAGAVADRHLVAAYDDESALAELAATCQVVTTEFENPPADALDRLARDVTVSPPPAAVRIAQDRIAEKRFLVEHGLPVGRYTVVEREADLDHVDPAVLADDSAAGVAEGVADGPSGGAVMKTARLGYDGKGQRRVASPTEAAAAWIELGSVPCVVEALLDLDCEVSVLIGRTAAGHTTTWPIAQNLHADGILDMSVVPATIDAALAERAVALATTIAEALHYVGVLAVEMFVVGGELLVNELAPRPHNSGHWSLDGAVTSQFEQQIRAVCGVELGDTSMTRPAVAMVNLLGDLWFTAGGQTPHEPAWDVVLADPHAKLHLYGKAAARPGRKMGHLTVLGTQPDAVDERARSLRASASD